MDAELALLASESHKITKQLRDMGVLDNKDVEESLIELIRMLFGVTDNSNNEF